MGVVEHRSVPAALRTCNGYVRVEVVRCDELGGNILCHIACGVARSVRDPAAVHCPALGQLTQAAQYLIFEWKVALTVT